MDLDEDGDLDAVFGDQAYYVDAANQVAHQILWAENSGGSFLIPKVLLNATEATELNSGDVDGDGDVDLVFSANGDVQAVENTAIHRTAEFSALSAGGSSSGISDLYFADVNNDGYDDVICSDLTGNMVRYTSGTANGLGAVSTFSNIPGAGAVAAGDLHHDGQTDIVVAAIGAGQLKTISRDNDGNWVLRDIFPLPAGTQELEVDDVNRDGDNDILIGHATGVTLLTGNGSFTPTWTEWTVAMNIGPVTNIRATQLNGIGWMEVISMTVETSPQRCRIHRSAFGTFGWLTVPPLWEGDYDSSLLAAGDANRDGGSDIFYAVGSNLNCAPSSLTSATLGTPKSVDNVSGFRCGETSDFNRDGITDLAIAGSHVVFLYVGVGNGTFLPPVGVFSKPGANITRIEVMDFERDGDMDILVSDESEDEVLMLRNHCGQFDLTELGMGELITTSASADPVAMHLTLTHAGRTGDATASIRNLRFRLLKGTNSSQGDNILGAGLTTAEATALISAVEVYNDAGEPMNFESGIDALLGTVGTAPPSATSQSRRPRPSTSP